MQTTLSYSFLIELDLGEEREILVIVLCEIIILSKDIHAEQNESHFCTNNLTFKAL